jgi:hypothetical protein
VAGAESARPTCAHPEFDSLLQEGVSGQARWRWRRLALLAAAVPAGCTHDGLFVPGVYSPGVPPGTGALVRRTYNGGADLAPSWCRTAAGSSIRRAARSLRPGPLPRPASGSGRDDRPSDLQSRCRRRRIGGRLQRRRGGAGRRLAYVRASAPLDVAGRSRRDSTSSSSPHWPTPGVTVLGRFPMRAERTGAQRGRGCAGWTTVCWCTWASVSPTSAVLRCPPDTLPRDWNWCGSILAGRFRCSRCSRVGPGVVGRDGGRGHGGSP